MLPLQESRFAFDPAPMHCGLTRTETCRIVPHPCRLEKHVELTITARLDRVNTAKTVFEAERAPRIGRHDLADEPLLLGNGSAGSDRHQVRIVRRGRASRDPCTRRELARKPMCTANRITPAC